VTDLGFHTRDLKVYDRDDADWYVEPTWAVEALLRAEPFEGLTLDPACGCGTIPKAFKAHGLRACGSDLRDRGFGPVADFLGPEFVLPIDNIVTNPPYNLAEKFIRRALMIATSKVSVLVQQQFPFSQGRFALFRDCPIARLYFLSNRPSMPPGRAIEAGTVTVGGGKVDYLWMVFEHGHQGAPTAHWLKRA
jgi:hypothetical protein